MASVSARAPGRVNLIGEHTDYTGGFVMPAAIQLSTSVTAAPRSDRRIVAHSTTLGETVQVELDQPLRRRGDWSDYVAGVVWVLREEGLPLAGAELTITSTVPLGAGLSSSAALEVACARALLGDRPVDRLTMATWCQRAENEFVGARCGIMDQYVACFGQPGHAILLDCRTLTSQPIAIPSGMAIVVLNTMVRHAVAAGEYNSRRADCETATSLLRRRLPHVESLRDVTRDELLAQADHLPPTALQRARHVVNENARVLQAADALQRSDFSLIGRLMADSHASLRDDYEVSCRELDLMVNLAATEPDLVGTRMTGGGFGGCTVSLVKRGGAEEFVTSMQRRYEAAAGVRPDAWICTASGGVELRS